MTSSPEANARSTDPGNKRSQSDSADATTLQSAETRLLSRRPVITATIIVLLLIASGLILRQALRRPIGDIPVVPTDQMHPGLADLLARQREKILQQPGSANAWGVYGMCLLQHERPGEALTCFNQAAELEPDNARWPFYAGMILEQTDYLKAHERFSRSIQLDGSYLPVQLREASILIRLGRTADATRLLQQCVQAAPETAEAYVQLVRLARESEDPQTATALLDKATAANAVSRELLLESAALQAAAGDMQSAARTRLQADQSPPARSFVADPWSEDLRRFDASGNVASATADQLRGSGQLSKAADSYLQLARQFPTRSRPALNRATLLLEIGQTSAAISELDELVRRFPDDPLALFQLAFARARNNEPDIAMQHLENVVRLKPDYAPAWAALADLYEKAGRPDDALPAYQSAVSAAPEHVAIQLALVRLLLTQNRVTEARKVLNNALRLPGAEQEYKEECSRLHRMIDDAMGKPN